MFNRFTDEAKQAMVDARTLAVSSRSNSIGDLEVLIASLGVPTSRASACLRNLGVDASLVCAEARTLLRANADESARGQVPFSDDGKRMLEHALRAAASLGHDAIGTEHFLIGVVELGGPPAKLVRTHVKDKEALWRATQRLRRDSNTDSAGTEWQSAIERLSAALDACNELGEFELAARLHALIESLKAR